MKHHRLWQLVLIAELVFILAAFVYFFPEIIHWIDCGDLLKGQC